MKKNGRRRGLQRYLCQACRHPFQSLNRTARQRNLLWQRYVFERQTVDDLHRSSGLSARQIRRHLARAPVIRSAPIEPQEPVVLVIDTTYFERYGVMVFRCATRRRNLLWCFVNYETNRRYLEGIQELEERGYQITAVVCDGKRWLAEALSRRFPVQHCIFHMMKTVTRYLTRQPLLPAGQELRQLTMTLPHTNKAAFSEALSSWQAKWSEFLKERSTDALGLHWHYTHRRIRGAYAALVRALPFLFTYQEYPERKIPTTTNTLDGTFSHLKQKIRVHRGLTITTQQKMISTLLGMPPKSSRATQSVH